MRSKGSRFTLEVWGLRVCSLDVSFVAATVRNRPQPFATGLQPFQDKIARLFFAIAAELWLRGRPGDIERTFDGVARSLTLRLAEQRAHAACNRVGDATHQCLLYATYWFRPILSELLGAAKESVTSNRERAPSGPVKVAVSSKPHSRHLAGVTVVSGVSTVIAWFPASWASKIALSSFRARLACCRQYKKYLSMVFVICIRKWKD